MERFWGAYMGVMSIVSGHNVLRQGAGVDEGWTLGGTCQYVIRERSIDIWGIEVCMGFSESIVRSRAYFPARVRSSLSWGMHSRT